MEGSLREGNKKQVWVPFFGKYFCELLRDLTTSPPPTERKDQGNRSVKVGKTGPRLGPWVRDEPSIIRQRCSLSVERESEQEQEGPRKKRKKNSIILLLYGIPVPFSK